MMRGGSLALALSLTRACAHGDPGDHPGPEPECRSAADCEPAPAACEQSACAHGACVLEPVEAGAACDDGLYCTQGEACDGNGNCAGGRSPCNELVPGLPRCNEAQQICEICSDGRPLVDGECRCPFYNCTARGGASFCAAEDQSEPNSVSCFFDGVTPNALQSGG